MHIVVLAPGVWYLPEENRVDVCPECLLHSLGEPVTRDNVRDAYAAAFTAAADSLGRDPSSVPDCEALADSYMKDSYHVGQGH